MGSAILDRAAKAAHRGLNHVRAQPVLQVGVDSMTCASTVLPARPPQSPSAREAVVAAAGDAVVVQELEATAMEIFGPYNAGVSRLGCAAAGKAAAA